MARRQTGNAKTHDPDLPTGGPGFRFEAKLWEYQGKGSWHFVTLPLEAAEQIRFFNQGATGFRMVRVRASIGGSTWGTSIFPDSVSKSYVLPVKAEVRKAEKLVKGDMVTVNLVAASRL